ncbi:hypothetical protein TNCV_2173481 [Trichonephila clavipes]|nr:hypothetical protein TNCV_2173481 [Trichonephila clavipes]
MIVVVKLELGHNAIEKNKPTKEGYTHDWNVFVRGTNGCPIEHFIEKVVFHLHESFPKPKRVPGPYFSEDKARPYTTRVAMNCLTACQALPWPARSPDLSSIEHVWNMMGRRLHLPGNVYDFVQ